MTNYLTEQAAQRCLSGLEEATGPTNHRFFHRRHDRLFCWNQLATIRKIWIINVWDHYTRDPTWWLRGRLSLRLFRSTGWGR